MSDLPFPDPSMPVASVSEADMTFASYSILFLLNILVEPTFLRSFVA